MIPHRAVTPAKSRAALLAQRPLAADPVAGLLDALRNAGINPIDPGVIEADGVLRRFRAESDKPGSRNCWFVLHSDHGAAGSWKSGATCSWSAKSTTKMSRAEKDAFHAAMRQAKAAAQREREAEQHAAAERAEMLWAKATPAKAEHPYLVRKRIPPGNARQVGDLLMLRIQDVNGKTRSLQYIGAGGTKRMLSDGAKRGHFILVAGALPAGVIVIAEGFATAATVATQFPGSAVLAAIDAGNLEPVALAIRAKFPAAEIVLCADDDRLTPGNPGLSKARAAAASVRGKVLRPAWPDGSPESLTDFNDLAAWLVEVSA